jgi:plasmid stabilization system protein ParE
VTHEFLPAARKELNDAVSHYDSQRPGLGDEFLDEVEAAIGRILRMPHAWQIVGRRTRRCRADRFPYGLVYRVEADVALIVAVMHLSRRPGYWRGRLPWPSPAERAGSRA